MDDVIVINGHTVRFDGTRYATIYNPLTDVLYEVSAPYFSKGLLSQHIDYQGKNGVVRSLRPNGPKHKQICEMVNVATEKDNEIS